MINQPIVLAIVTMFAWGGWAIFATLSTQSLPPAIAIVLSYAAGTAVTLAYVVTRGIRVDLLSVPAGTEFAILAGIVSAIGGLTLYAGLGKGDAAIVTTISALYFVVAAIAGVLFLGESITVRDFLGIVFAILAIILISS
ncbi:EamA family transporter [Halalkaliarchaeum desulfuricum]|uniref:EamA family transporter n=1 Tax=Halalkaliarchaeum desulfuricum TaxID=2055893 RepID=UPI000E6C9790|nr:EamA family transporter [Halalkaliarchaeum desulfuricum]